MKPSTNPFPNLRKALLATAVFGTLALTGCAADAADTAAEPAPSSSPSATAEPSVQTSADPTREAPKNALPSGAVIDTSHGQYLQTTIADDDPALQVDSALVEQEIYAAFKPEDIASAQKFVLKFIAEEGIDSAVNGGGQTTDEWVSEHADLLSPEYSEEFRASLADGAANNVITIESWQKQYDGAYSYVYSPETQRVASRTLSVADVYTPEPGSIAFKVNVEWGMPVVRADGKDYGGVQISKGYMNYGLTKNPETGQWLISGWQHDVNTTEG
ncbi:hypothetical protein [Arthrobacter sp. MDT1-65]